MRLSKLSSDSNTKPNPCDKHVEINQYRYQGDLKKHCCPYNLF